MSGFYWIDFKFKKYKNPLIIVCSKKLLQEQMKKLKFNYKINIVDKDFAKLDALNNKQINLVNVDYNFKRCFEKISNKSNNYMIFSQIPIMLKCFLVLKKSV